MQPSHFSEATSEIMNDTPRILRVTSNEDLISVQQLRYQVFVKELGWSIDADPEAGIRDPADSTCSLLFLEKVGDEPVATAAIDIWSEADITQNMIEHYQLDQFVKDWPKEKIGLIRKFAVADQYRGTKITLKILKAMFQASHEAGLLFNFMDCSPYLVSFYECIGCRRYAPHFYYEETHIIAVPMVIVMRDLERQKRLRSPFVAVAHQCGIQDHPASRRWMDEHYGILVLNFEAPDQKQPLTMPHEQLNSLNIKDVSLFKNVDQHGYEKIVKMSEVVTFKRTDMIVKEGEPGSDLFLIYKGYADATIDKTEHPVALATLGPGDVFGEVNFLERTKRSATVRALTDCELLKIPVAIVGKLTQTDPHLMLILYRNIAQILAVRLKHLDRWVMPIPL